jgi:beta-galactosidase GanA
VILGGELHNSSASSLEYMEPIWDRLVALNLNTVLATVSWELLEPEEGKFDFRLVDGLIAKAREHDLKLVLLWFGSWKNGVSTYAPAWVKKDTQRFPRVKRRNGQSTEVLTPLAIENVRAEVKAFSALMRRIREIDEVQQTVIMVQVNNEVGLLGDSRDRSPLAEQLFDRPVAAELLRYFSENRNRLIPEFKVYWERAGARTSGTWAEVFGEGADEAFMAYAYAHCMNGIAAAGKRQYDIPMFANAWLVQNEAQKPGQYPSGGPVSKVMDIWRAAGNDIEFLAPDIYLPDFKGVCASYVRNGNPLFIPEASRGPDAAGKAFYAIGQHDALGFCPFGIDSVAPDHPLRDAYGVLRQLIPLITRSHGQMIGLLQDKPEAQNERAELAGYSLEVSYAQRGPNAAQVQEFQVTNTGAAAAGFPPATWGNWNLGMKN